jgi:hypothetical protein
MGETAARNKRMIATTITDEDASGVSKQKLLALIAVVALIAGSVAAQHQRQHKGKFARHRRRHRTVCRVRYETSNHLSNARSA